MADADRSAAPPEASTATSEPVAIELKALRERVRTLERSAGAADDATTLLSMLSHELRSPVHVLSLGIDVALERVRSSADTLPREWLVERLETQRRAARRLKSLIDTFLEVAQLSAGMLPLDLGPVDLREVASDAVRGTAEDLGWSGSRCALDAPGPVVGQWDRLQLDLVVGNLLSNAIKYGEGRAIELRVIRDGHDAVLSIRDHGPGIAPEHHARIFEKFVRVPGAARVGGVGLGLWMVRQIVEALGGNVRLSSTVGDGATFTVTLPLVGPTALR